VKDSSVGCIPDSKNVGHVHISESTNRFPKISGAGGHKRKPFDNGTTMSQMQMSREEMMEEKRRLLEQLREMKQERRNLDEAQKKVHLDRVMELSSSLLNESPQNNVRVMVLLMREWKEYRTLETKHDIFDNIGTRMVEGELVWTYDTCIVLDVELRKTTTGVCTNLTIKYEDGGAKHVSVSGDARSVREIWDMFEDMPNNDVYHKESQRRDLDDEVHTWYVLKRLTKSSGKKKKSSGKKKPTKPTNPQRVSRRNRCETRTCPY
jgi:hypothetical protein